MPLEALNRTLPTLSDSLTNLPAISSPEVLWESLQRLMLAHAPSGGANLLGGIGDDIAVLADGLGLRDRVKPQIGSTGNTGLWLGADKSAVDVVVVAHMDRLSFRVKSVENGTLYPIGASRFPPGEYRVAAKAVRFEKGRLVVGAQGVLVSERSGKQDSVRMEVRRGKLAWHDTVLLDVNPTCCDGGGIVIGGGLDNSASVLVALLTAAALRGIEDALRDRERRCLFVFTDREEGLPDGLSGYGAARLRHAFSPPTYGCVIVDAQEARDGLMPELGQGTGHGVVSDWGRGSVVPPNYHALAVDLAAALNEARPNTVQMNHGYLPRGDDAILGRWARILALSGPPVANSHTGQESANLGDIQSGVWWLSYFLAAVLNLVPDLAPRYALGK